MRNMIMTVLFGLSMVYPVRQIALLNQDAPRYIAHGQHGEMWVSSGQSIEKISAHGKITTYQIQNHFAFNLAVDQAGTVWFLAEMAMIGTLREGKMTFYQIPTNNAPGLVYWGSKMWFVAGTTLYSINPGGKVKAEYMFACKDSPLKDLQLAEADGEDFWFYGGNKIVRLHKKHTTIYTTPDPIGSITKGPDGLMWFTSLASVGHVNADGTITTFHPGISDGVGAIVEANGALWFSEVSSIDRITTTGAFTQVTGLGARDVANSMVQGPGNTVWFTYPTGYNDAYNDTVGIISV